MNNKQYQILFLVAVLCLIIGAIISYLIFVKDIFREEFVVTEQAEQGGSFLPVALVEGILYDIDISKRKIVIDIIRPEEVAGERVEILFDIERTKFVELLLEVDGPNSVKDVGRQTIDYNLLSSGDEVLVDVGDIAVDAIKEKRVLSASTITLITAK